MTNKHILLNMEIYKYDQHRSKNIEASLSTIDIYSSLPETEAISTGSGRSSTATEGNSAGTSS